MKFRLPKKKIRLVLLLVVLLIVVGVITAIGVKFYLDNQKQEQLESYVTGFNLPSESPDVKKTVQKFDNYSVSYAEVGSIDSPVVVEVKGGKISFTSLGNHDLGGLNSAPLGSESGTITYKNIYNGIDLHYTVTEDKILEEYEVKAKRKIDYLAQKIDIKDLTYEKKDDGSIIFSNASTNEFAFAIPQPVMYEKYNTKNRNFGLHYEIFEYNGNTYLLKIIDEDGKEWLKNSHYPVMIDATILLTLFSYTSYPTVDGTWQIDAQTVGSGDLSINTNGLGGLTLACDSKNIEYESTTTGEALFSNFSCEGNIVIKTTVGDPTKQNSLDISYSGFTTTVSSIVDTGKPIIISSFVNPPVVKVGDTITVSVEVADTQGMESVTADMGGIDKVNLNLTDGTTTHGTWTGSWKVRNTATKPYEVLITATDIGGETTEASIGFFDPYTCLGGGDHAGADWNPVSDGCASNEIAGEHTNIGIFSVDSGQTASVKAFDGVNQYGIATISASTVTVAGTMTATAKGWAGGVAHAAGAGPGGGGANSGGGGHGGTGGVFASGVAGIIYGSLSTPIEMGSGGGGENCSNTGATGGGAINITASGSLSVTGTISANGNNNTGCGGGGGSGGGVYTYSSSISGSGTVSANGGSGFNSVAGGGGGRIAMYYTTSNSFSGTVTITGGATGTNGTAFIKNPVTGDLTITGSNGTWYSDDDMPSWQFHDLSINGNVAFRPDISSPSLFTITSTGSASFASGVTVTAHGSYNTNTNGAGVYLNLAGNVSIPATTTITANAKGYAGGGVNTSGAGPGGGDSGPGGAGGGSNGGAGGIWGTATTANAYGSLAEPVDLGSGGGGEQYSNTSAYGGGAIKISTTGTLTVSGSITANGTGYAQGGGGGSGGSIYLDVQSLAGDGTISANGLTAWSNAGGGGGRIAVHYDNTNSFSGTLSVTPGTGASYGTAFYLKSDGSLTVPTTNGIWNGDDDLSPWIFKDLTINSNITFLPATATLFTITSTGSASFASGITITPQGKYTTNSDGFGLYLKLRGNVTIPATTAINANGKGYSGGGAHAAGAGPGGGGANSGGGGYGGSGGTYGSGVAGTTYGSSTDPVDLGSGGGGENCSNTTAYGGGAIKLTTTGTLTVSGSITANGINYAGCGGGGGSGGSVYLVATTLAGNGTISATGGTGYNSTAGGGGGRLAIYYKTSSWTGNSLTAAGAATASTNGTNGTVNATTSYACLTGGNHYGVSWNPATDCAGGFAGEHTNIDELYVDNGETATVQAFDGVSSYGIATMSAVTANIAGTITANGKGWSGGASGGANGAGPGRGGGAPAGAAGGAGYGGNGGAGIGGTPGFGGTSYGSLSMPGAFGSGGGAGPLTAGGSGGGAIKITTTGTLLVNGTINANGGNGVSNCGGSGGGGSGGSIYFSVGSIEGSGSISANGGAGGSCNGGNGGGGRAVIYHNEINNFSGSITATKGTGGAGEAGIDGTVFIKNLANGDLVIPSNNGIWRGSDDMPSWLFRNLNINGNISFYSSNATLLIITSTGSSTFKMGVTVSASGSATTNSNGVGVYFNLTGNVIIPASTTITANSSGYTRGILEGDGAGPGRGGGAPAGAAGGAGYGGNGGAGIGGTPGFGGTSYGSLTDPLDLGSGGGSGAAGSGQPGGSGGGAIKITTTGTLLVNGTINANGGNGVSNCGGSGGGGSGGSIYLSMRQLQGTGTIQAVGGAGGGCNGGNGGGGRIALYCSEGGNWVGNSLASSSAAVAGSGGAGAAGGNGTVYTNNCYPVNPRIYGGARIYGGVKIR